MSELHGTVIENITLAELCFNRTGCPLTPFGREATPVIVQVSDFQ